MGLALVTGAARGIGAAICRRLAADGWQVAGLDRDEAALEAAGDATARRFACDVTDERAVEEVLAVLGEAPRLVVNNAGIVRFGPLLELDLEAFRAVVEVNLVGTFVVARAAARAMAAAGGGAIVNITSMNGVAPGPNAGAYGATKAGVALLTQQMALEWGPRGIRVNAVAPGLIDAGMSEPIYADPAARAARESKVPLGRLGRAEDVAALVSFLGSDEAAYITGQNILVDGGVTASVIAHLPRPAAVDTVGLRP
ncbi:MAG TPA: SDR family NAD(P)-dependent oxidoreductase [Acidimicrobiales bacterium]|jgi:NAD(P)-dependent dehydrogenase (short-subunit alcohol dehydrogenase family)|nr:SDR family NAD(P)-dependent oxidoreductase [Acidimicrobiales bacterium]